MKKIFVLLLALAALLALWLPASADTELLINGDASRGLEGWTDEDGIWVTRTEYDSQITAYDGFFFMPSAFKTAYGARTRIYQEVSVSGLAGAETEFSAMVCTWDTNNTDETLLMVEYFDGGGNLLARAEATSANDPSWHRIAVNSTVPAGAVTARLSLYAVYWYGSECDSYFDNVSYTVSAAKPAPVSATELLINGSASQGLEGWTDEDGIWVTRTEYDSQITAYDGSFFMPSAFKTAYGDRTRIYQDVSVSGMAGAETEFSAMVRTWDANNTDETLLMVEYFDGGGNLLAQAEATSANDPAWHRIAVSSTVPAGAVAARLSLYAVYWYGSECDSYFDGVSFVIYGAPDTPAHCWVLVETVHEVDENVQDGARTWIYEYKDIPEGGQYVIDYTWRYQDEYSHYTAVGECTDPPAYILPDQRFAVGLKVYNENVVGNRGWGILGMGYIQYNSQHYANTKGFFNVIENDPISYNAQDGDRAWQLWAEFPEGMADETISFTCQFHRGDRHPVKTTWTYAWRE